MSSLVYSREYAEATALFVFSCAADLVIIDSLKMWFQPVEFQVSCTVDEYVFSCITRQRNVFVR